MIQENDYINNILALHFSGEKLTDDQEKNLINWICEHKEDYQKLSELFQQSESSSLHPMTFDRKQAWEKINSKLTQPKRIKLHNFRQYLTYAACIGVLLGISIFFLKKKGNEQYSYNNSTNELLAIMLPDSSTVTLYPNANISYIANLKNNNRTTVLEGKAFFKVKPNPQQPFIVKNHETYIQVLGTSFLVNGLASSETSVFVREGVVQVSTETQEVILKANEQALTNGANIIKTKIENPESIFTRHVKHKIYNNTPISKVIKDIEEEFNVNIIIRNSLLDNRVSTTLKFLNIEEILSEITYICNFEYKKVSDKEYEFYKP